MRISVLGSGFSSLSAACYLAQQGHQVSVYEKNGSLGGRAQQYKHAGFTFDMGPTWYWMPDVFERFFQDFGHVPSDYYALIKLSPGYQVFFGKDDVFTVSDDLDAIVRAFEAIETGAGERLKTFLAVAQSNYEIAIKDLVYRPGEHIFELITPKTAAKLGQFFSNIQADADRLFKDTRLRQILTFPSLFLGAKPSDTPSFYSFMNWADLGLGTWHPKGGMYAVVQGMADLAESLGVKLHTHASVEGIGVIRGEVNHIVVHGQEIATDLVVSGADYAHTEQLLPRQYRQYSDQYWNSKTWAPSALLFYVGFSEKVSGVEHHALFFDTDFSKHAYTIYDDPSWPEEPLFYTSFPSKTETSWAPEGQEAATFLIPLAPGLDEAPEVIEEYFNLIMTRLEFLTGQELKSKVLFKKHFCVADFITEYNSFKGNAYGLANTLLQTHILRPKLKSKKVKGLYFTGQLTVPGPGVPPALISGKLTAELIAKYEPKP